MTGESLNFMPIRKLFESEKYVIPYYQRNYDWGADQSLQLLEDIADYARESFENYYYIGTLIVFPRKEHYEVIDGQQRLTTLSILLAVLNQRNEEGVKDRITWYRPGALSYDHRDESSDELQRLWEKGSNADFSNASGITTVFKILEKHLDSVLAERNLKIEAFTDYLLEKVAIIRVPVPNNTDLNHYFEIMNSRGEQLEKHEVLKATLMKPLDPTERSLFASIWEACSDMNRYVQKGFDAKTRSIIFSDSWDSWQYDSFDKLHSAISESEGIVSVDDSQSEGSKTLKSLISDAGNSIKYRDPYSSSDRSDSDRYGSVINFPNFLLHVLKVMTRDNKVVLDDKRLINTFDDILSEQSDKKGFVKEFAMSLLRLRFLFDRYVIKPEISNDSEHWSLKALKRYEKGAKPVGSFTGEEDDDDLSRDIRMLEAMFHVSAPTQIYKNWLNAIMKYVYDHEIINQKEFRNFLFELARTYMLDRYLCQECKRVDFDDIIYKNQVKAINKVEDIDWDTINRGCNVENFVFNFYDYLLWCENKGEYSKFAFTYRTSVEHFYPQNPPELHAKLDSEDLNNFGNLCLISRGMNSRFSNNMPLAKVENFGPEAQKQEISLKFIEMMKIAKQAGRWTKDEIFDYYKDTKDCLCHSLNDGLL